MEFIIIFLVGGGLGYLLFFHDNNKRTKHSFNVESNLGEVVFVQNCYFTTHDGVYGKRTDPIIYRIYYNKDNNKYTLRGYGDGWEEHKAYNTVFSWYRGVVEGVYEIRGGVIIKIDKI